MLSLVYSVLNFIANVVCIYHMYVNIPRIFFQNLAKKNWGARII